MEDPILFILPNPNTHSGSDLVYQANLKWKPLVNQENQRGLTPSCWYKEITDDFQEYMRICVLNYKNESTEFGISVCSNLWMDSYFQKALHNWNIILKEIDTFESNPEIIN